ncbi:glycosyltransferase family 52 protein, partial [Glaesserella parasuis]|nr:glycosyltransferase family 52 protein [Glaesserella parasuis]
MNLIICTTPFQMLIAEKVIEKNQCDIFHLVVFSSTWNDKYQHYMEKLLSHKNVIFLKKYVVCKDKQFSRLCQLILVRILSLFLRGNVNKVYVASIDSIWVRLFLSSLDKFNLYTFDDGTANIFKNSFFYKDDSFLMKFIMKLLCSRYTMLDLKRMSLEHYTIYKNRENIV